MHKFAYVREEFFSYPSSFQGPNTRTWPASPPPSLGTDTASLLAELGYSEGEIKDLSRDKAI